MLEIIKEDYKLNSHTSFFTLLFYRLENRLFARSKKAHFILRPVISFMKRIFGIEAQISFKAKIGRRLRLPHKGNGVMISSKAQIGNDVTIFHQVTIGVNESKSSKPIVVGDNCYLSSGCKIISCVIGDDVTIVPNAVVYKDCLKPGLIISDGSYSD